MVIVNALQSAGILGILGFAFYAMARRGVPQALAMPLAACALLAMMPGHAPAVCEAAFHDFGAVALLFTTVAVPAHIIERSNAFSWLGATIGAGIGGMRLRRHRWAVPALVFSLLPVTFAAAALFHNITSVMIMTPITIAICAQYEVPTRWLLSGELIASNLGGFSTSWGDTPNIIERAVWSLTNRAFFVEILPLNLLILLLLGLAVLALTRRSMADRPDPFRDAYATAAQQRRQEHISIDTRRLLLGLAALAVFIVLQTIDRETELAVGAMVIAAVVVLDRAEDRQRTLQALDLDLYMVLASIFVLARAVDRSPVGAALAHMVGRASGSPLAIAASAYLGTALTEAASWASATARATHAVNSGHAGAFSLGAGICAGSSSLLTAASAGLILWSQSRRFKGHEVTFGRYLAFGLPASLAMLALYVAYFTLVR